jgi:hypothetical protein
MYGVTYVMKENFYTSSLLYRLNSGYDWSKPPRLHSVYIAAEAEGLFDRWCLRKYLDPILNRYKATDCMSCCDVIHREKGYLDFGPRKDGRLRRVLTDLGLPMDPSLGIVYVTETPRSTDVHAIVLEMQMEMGSSGLKPELYPIMGARNAILVRILDLQTARQSWRNRVYIGRKDPARVKLPDPNAKWPRVPNYNYRYSASLVTDPTIDSDDVIPEAELKMKLARGPIPRLAGISLNTMWESPRHFSLPSSIPPSDRQKAIADLETKIADLRREIEARA